MKQVNPIFARLVAVLLLVIPGWAATYGFLVIKNTLFAYFSQHGDDGADPSLNWLKLIIGIVLFLAGISFIGGWIFFRDRKRNYVAPRFKEKKPPRRPQNNT
ncbi:DUF2627 domain-containing protein [Marinicrinis lubricantis]|uniref:DUF2627 domain-containing protein n=1 Tax=Marinicrinis lubricantis TaxID=2086470 RepID=A0ABW1ISP1_9BACL